MAFKDAGGGLPVNTALFAAEEDEAEASAGCGAFADHVAVPD